MALADIDISKPKAEDAPRRHHPAAPWMPVLTVLLLGLAVAANLGALLTTAWLKTTAYPTLFNAEGMIVTGVNGTVTTRVSAMEICFSITNVTKPIRAHDYCLSLTTTSSSQSACQVVQSKKALAATNVDWDSDMAEFLRLACGGVGDATVVLQLGAVAVAGFAILTVTLTCCVRGRIGRTLRIIATAACVFSGLLAISAYMLWLTKLSTGDMHHGKSAVLTAGSLFLFGGAALAASSGLETFRTPPPHSLNDGEPMGEEEIEAKAEAPRPLPVAA